MPSPGFKPTSDTSSLVELQRCSRRQSGLPPSPVPTTTTIDAASFPHIIDLVFDHAPLKSLLALRQVNRAWKSRATCQIGYHTIIKDDDRHVTVRSGFGSGGVFVYPFHELDQDFWTRWSFFQPTFPFNPHVCDFVSTGPTLSGGDSGCMRLAMPLKNVNTFRFLQSSEVQGIAQLRSHRVVYFDYQRNWAASHQLTVYNMKKVVIHLTCPSDSDSALYLCDPLGLLNNQHTVVLILHPWVASTMRGSSTVADAVKAAIRSTLGGLLRFVKACKSKNAKLFIVGLERLTHESLGLSSEHSAQGETVPFLVAEYLKREHRLHDGEPQPGKFSITYLRIDQYREKIGERDFEIETQEKLTALPRTFT